MREAPLATRGAEGSTRVGRTLAAKPACDSSGPKEKIGDGRGDTRWWGELADEHRARRHCLQCRKG